MYLCVVCNFVKCRSNNITCFIEVIKYMIRKRNYSLNSKYESGRRNTRYRFESANSGEDLYNEISNDLTSLEESIQDRFEDICKSKYNYIRVSARIAVEDGIENDNGDPMLRFYLFADYKAFSRYMRKGDTRKSIFELTYSFRDDGLYEDDEYFNGTTEKDLIDAVAESFAKSLDDSEY